MPSNPLIASWTSPHGLPPFTDIRTEHYEPAFEAALAAAASDIERIAADPAPATFANTITALETSGELLTRVSSVFWGIAGTDTTPEIQALERQLAPKLTAHRMKIYQNQALFARVDAIDARKEALGLADDQRQVLKRYVRAFVNSGARLDASGKARLKAIAEQLASLSTRFSQNVLKDEQSWFMLLEEADLAGLDAAQRAAAAQAAADRGHPGKHAITLSRSSVTPFLEYSRRRDLRAKAYAAFIARGANGGDSDNRAVLGEIVALRAEYAKLLGFPSYAAMSLEPTMAKTPEGVQTLLGKVWPHARAAALAERDLLSAAARADGDNEPLTAADWRFYAEKVRKARFDLDEAEVKPYLQLDRMIEAAFACAEKLFGLTFKPLDDVKLHNPEARAWEVRRADGRPVGIFIGDYFARASKRSGAWMSAYRGQHKLAATADGVQRPIITNTCNFAKPAPGEAALLSLDDARTLFHEFGHALHGLLSDVTYPSIAGTSVARDFVELPSQLYEHWLTTDGVLKRFAVHHATGAPIPDDLIRRMKAAQSFNQGFAKCEFLGSAFVDMDLHQRSADAPALDVDAVERACLARIGMPAEIAMRHRPAHFQHITGGYAAGYYSYLWSEVLDADAFRAFTESGDVFDPATARRLHDHIYSSGGSREPEDAYRGFRGRLPDVTALLVKNGFLAEPPTA
jgi:peptidyl-dipeptidase Dcp